MPGIASETSDRTNRGSRMVLVFVLLVFACAILLLTYHLRAFMKAKIVQQDGIALGAALMISPSLTKDLPEGLASDPEIVFTALADRVLEAAKRQEVIGVRVFDRIGELRFSIGCGGKKLTDKELTQLHGGKAISWFEPNAKLSEVVEHKADTVAPLIRAIVPLDQKGGLIGAAEFILDGRAVAQALATLDRNLWIYSGLIFLLGACLTSGAVLWTFREKSSQRFKPVEG